MEDSDPRHGQLYDAIVANDDATALSIVREDVDVNGEWNGLTHLFNASRWNRVAVVPCLLELGADVNKTKPDVATPLGAAARYGYQEVAELLIEVGHAHLDHRGALGWTALYQAAFSGYLDTAKYLLAHGCSIDVQDNFGRTALNYAIQPTAHREIIQSPRATAALPARKARCSGTSSPSSEPTSTSPRSSRKWRA
jgi:ankyrin repeat protein